MLWNYLALLKQSKLIEPSNNTNLLWLSTTIKAEEEKKKKKPKEVRPVGTLSAELELCEDSSFKHEIYPGCVCYGFDFTGKQNYLIHYQPALI